MTSPDDAMTVSAGPLDLYRSMVALRRFEEPARALVKEGHVNGTSHLSIGQESIAADFAAPRRRDDHTFCTYRRHAHTLAWGHRWRW